MISDNRLTRDEQDFEYVSQFIDLELFALELEHTLDWRGALKRGPVGARKWGPPPTEE